MMLSDVCVTSVAYIGPKSITEKPRKTKIGTEVAHVTCDPDTTFKVKRSKVNLQGRGILWRPPAYSSLFLCGFVSAKTQQAAADLDECFRVNRRPHTASRLLIFN